MIEVGEYVRTKNGQISKNNSNYDWDLSETYINDSPVIKHSKNIIDLIEKDDFVNGYRVYKVEAGYVYTTDINPSTELYKTFVDYQIKEILTKEQYEANCYKVKEE